MEARSDAGFLYVAALRHALMVRCPRTTRAWHQLPQRDLPLHPDVFQERPVMADDQ